MAAGNGADARAGARDAAQLLGNVVHLVLAVPEADILALIEEARKVRTLGPLLGATSREAESLLAASDAAVGLARALLEFRRAAERARESRAARGAP